LDLRETEALRYWLALHKETFVAKENGSVLGTHFSCGLTRPAAAATFAIAAT
jgi:hypothetical protein